MSGTSEAGTSREAGGQAPKSELLPRSLQRPPQCRPRLLHPTARPGSSALPLCSRGEPTAHAVTPLPAEARLPRHPPHRGARSSADPALPPPLSRPRLRRPAAPRLPLAGGATAAAPRLPQGLQRVQDVALHPRARRQLPHAGAAPRGARLKPALRNPRPPPRSAAAAPQPRQGGGPGLPPPLSRRPPPLRGAAERLRASPRRCLGVTPADSAALPIHPCWGAPGLPHPSRRGSSPGPAAALRIWPQSPARRSRLPRSTAYQPL